MHEVLGDLQDARASDALPLLTSERVVGGFQLDERTLPDGTSVNSRLEEERWLSVREPVTQPPEVGRLGFSSLLLPQL